jgi:hypothetical protein
MSRTQLAFNTGDLAFQEIITSRPNRDSDRPIAPFGYFLFARDSPIIGASHDFQRDSASILTLIQTVLQQFWCLAARRPFIDCSESENIQHAIGADSNQLVSVHAEGDRV